VSVPVEVYVVVKVPSLTVSTPLARIPSENSDVPVVSGTVPVPVAGPSNERVGPVEFGEPAELADALVELFDAAAAPVLLELVELPCSALCTAAVRALLTRLKAV